MNTIEDSNLARILGGVEQAVRDLDKTLQRVLETQDSQDKRIGALERAKAWVLGAWAVAGFVAAAIAAKLGFL